jgi:hypothetical protein
MVMKGTRRNLGDPGRSSNREYLPTSREGKKVETPARESDMPIVVMKQGNACGAKGHALLRRGTMKHFPISELDRNGNKTDPPNKECRRVLPGSSSGEPDEGNPHVR